MKNRFLALSLLTLFISLSGCGDSTSAPQPSRIVITPGNVSMDALGLTEQFSAKVEDGQGRPVTGVTVVWSSSNEAVATVSSSGLATGVSRGTTSIRASAEGLTASTTLTVAQVPTGVVKVSGDDQTGALSQVLTQELAVEVTDAQGNPIAGQVVSFGIVAGGGKLNPAGATTNDQGLATTIWTLGCSEANPQRVSARAGSISVEFSATADLALPAICDTVVPDGRVTLPYSAQLVAVGGDSSTRSWNVQGGTLPVGLSLTTEGLLAGTPTLEGSYTFQLQAVDGTGSAAVADFGMKICAAPIALAPGGSVTVPAVGSGGCGLLLPTGEVGDRYRLGVVWATSSDGDTVGIPSVTVSGTKVLPAGVSPQFSPVLISDPAGQELATGMEGLPEGFKKALEMEASTAAFHNRLRARELQMLREMGPGARLLPDGRETRTTSAPERAAPEKLSLYPNSGTTCTPGAKATALKVAENDLMVFYQDSAQAQIDSLKITPDLATQLLDYYRDYGQPVIDEYFGGTTDINNDGQIVVFATPAVGSGVAAFVWSGDFFSTSSCAASNEMELVRINAGTVRSVLDGNYQAFGTLVHEVKHVSSLYNGISRYNLSGGTDPGYQPTWIEEGTAEIAGEMSSRLAWAADGGPALTDMIFRSDKFPITKAKYGVLLRWVRTIFHLGLQPNGLVGTPTGADDDHSVYGSGWHFHRWLGDAYGNAASTPMADAPLFVILNDSVTASGPQGIKNVTGKSWNELLDEYVTAFLLNGTGAPEPTLAITSYDFPDVTNGLLNNQRPGIYPWAVNVSGNDTTMAYGSFFNQGTIGPSGIRVYDLTSDGTGVGLEVKVDTSRNPVRIIVVRIQ